MTSHIQPIDTSGRKISILHDDTSPTAFLYMGDGTDAWLTVDIDGDIYPDSQIDVNTVPEDVWNRETLRIDLPSNVSAKALHQWLGIAQTQNLLQELHTGHKLRFDRQRQREVGSLTDEAEEALAMLEYEAAELDTLEVWDAESWLYESTLQTIWPDDKTLQQAVQALNPEIEEREIHIDGDLNVELLNRAIEGANNGLLLSNHQLEAISLHGRSDEIMSSHSE